MSVFLLIVQDCIKVETVSCEWFFIVHDCIKVVTVSCECFY